MKPNKIIFIQNLAGALAILTLCLLVPAVPAQTRTLRIAEYNVAADINGFTLPFPGLIAPITNTNNVQAGGTVEGIGEEILADNVAQPLDVLTLTETTSNPTTVVPIVNALNAFYAYHNQTATYTNSPYQAASSDGDITDGNGPNALIYNTSTLQLLASVPVDPTGGTNSLGSSSGELREVMRYEFAPAGTAATATNEFYVYVSHYKSGENGTATADATERNGEAQIIRSNSATLSASSRMLFVGDFNSGLAAEPMFITLTKPGINQAIDPLNSTDNTNLNFDTNSTWLVSQSEHSYELEYRDDYQMMTTNVYYGSGIGLKLVSGTYHVFGNNGTTPLYGSVNSGSDTALTNLVANAPISAATLFLDLTNASDHLPIVADYTIPIPVPAIGNVTVSGGNLVFNVDSTITNGSYRVLASSSLFPAYTNWTALATNIATGGSLVITVTNAFSPGAPAQFYILNQM